MGAKVAYFFQTDAFLSFFYLQVSQKSRTFADVIELNRHIEILLLSSDCVIVPDLGGFVTHHVDARYDADDQMFVPPLRTLGFNPQLTLNDPLLAQSYVEAYDITYPEAVRRIESEVAELKQQLNTDGYYEMNGIGVLSLNEDGRIVFEPCEAGLLTPELYGLGAFEMLPLNSSGVVNTVATAMQPSAESDETAVEVEDTVERKEGAIVIKMSWIRNVTAVAAAILLFLILTPPVANSLQPSTPQVSMSQVELLPMPKKVEPKTLDTSMVKVNSDSVKADKDTIKTTADSVSADKVEAAESHAESAYCLVLASQVAQKGAEHLVSQMKKQGYDDTRIHVHNNVRRVVYGHYASQGAAYQALNKLRNAASGFDEAWVYKVN